MPNIGAVILAAGESSRLGWPKQLLQFRGQTLVRRIADAAREADCSPTVVVIGSNKETIARELEQTAAVLIENEHWSHGIGASIRVGVQHMLDISPNTEAMVLLVCDQPFVNSNAIEQLIALRRETKKAVVASSYANTLGVPALFDRSCANELLRLDDASGAKQIISSNHDRVAEFLFPEGKIDIDIAADYDRLCLSEDWTK